MRAIFFAALLPFAVACDAQLTQFDGNQSNETASDAGAEQTTGDASPEGPGPIAAGDGSFQFGECGTGVSSGLTASRSPSSPTKAPVGKVVSGRVDEDDPNANAEYWVFDLPAGDYMLVAEATRADGDDSNVGLRLFETDTDGKKDETLISINEIGFRARSATRYSVAVDRQLMVRVDPSFDMEDYRFAFYAKDDPIPTQRLMDCDGVEKLELGRVHTLTMEDRDADNWRMLLVAPLEAGDYPVQVKSSRTDNDDSNVGARVFVLGEAADEGDADQILSINEIDFSAQDTGKMALARDQVTTLMVRPSFGENVVEVIVTKN